MLDSEENYVNLSASMVIEFMRQMLKAISKLLSIGYYQEAKILLQASDNSARIMKFISFADRFKCYKQEPPILGIVGLSLDYYIQGGGWQRNSHFLFGTASQFRKKRKIE